MQSSEFENVSASATVHGGTAESQKRDVKEHAEGQKQGHKQGHKASGRWEWRPTI